MREKMIYSWLRYKYVKIHKFKFGQHFDQSVQFNISPKSSYPVYLGEMRARIYNCKKKWLEPLYLATLATAIVCQIRCLGFG